mgnify:CR=1 FL=1
MEKKNKWTIAISLIVYFMVLTWIIMFKCALVPLDTLKEFYISFIPFEQIKRLIDQNLVQKIPFQILVIIMNILLFVPLGFLLNALIKKKWLKITIFILFGVIFEFIQLFTKFGVFDIWDMILNLVGELIGIILLDKFKRVIFARWFYITLKVLSIIGICITVIGYVFTAIRYL